MNYIDVGSFIFDGMESGPEKTPSPSITAAARYRLSMIAGSGNVTMYYGALTPLCVFDGPGTFYIEITPEIEQTYQSSLSAHQYHSQTICEIRVEIETDSILSVPATPLSFTAVYDAVDDSGIYTVRIADNNTDGLHFYEEINNGVWENRGPRLLTQLTLVEGTTDTYRYLAGEESDLFCRWKVIAYNASGQSEPLIYVGIPETPTETGNGEDGGDPETPTETGNGEDGGDPTVPLQVKAAPSVWLQLLHDQLLAVVRAHPSVVRLAWAWDNEPLMDVAWELLNPDRGMPLILKIPGFIPHNDAITHIITVQAWQEANEYTSARTTATIAIKPKAGTILRPPVQATAMLLRQFSTDWRDLTRIDWDWGNQPPGQVEIKAYIRPVNGYGRQIKNLTLGVMDSEARQFFVEGIGMKILTDYTTPQNVYFGLSQYYRGESGPEIYTAPVGIKAKVQGEASALPTPDQLAGRAVALTHTDWVNFTAMATAQTTLLVSQVLTAALVKIKRLISQGGRLELADFGTFMATWSDLVYRKDPITSQVTISPAQRRPAFNPSPGFRVGVQQGVILSDVEASPEVLH